MGLLIQCDILIYVIDGFCYSQIEVWLNTINRKILRCYLKTVTR